MHHLPTAYFMGERILPEQHQQPGRFGLGENVSAAEPDFDPGQDLIGRDARTRCHHDRVGVVASLQQARHWQRGHVDDQAGGLLPVHQGSHLLALFGSVVATHWDSFVP